MKKWALAIYVFIVLVIFFPREKLYYSFESLLSEQKIYFSNETISDLIVYLNVKEIDVILQNTLIAKIDQIRFSFWVVTNTVELSDISVEPDYKIFFPGSIDTIQLRYSVWDPIHIQIYGKGDFGQCDGQIDLWNQKTYIVFSSTPQMRRYPLLMSKLHPEKGGFVYERDF